jgi:hypothetical protein
MGDIVFLKEELEKSQITLTEIEILPLEIRAKTGQGFLIYFSNEIPIKTQIEVLLKTLQETISAEEQKNLKYIDLRGLKEGQKGLIYFQ